MHQFRQHQMHILPRRQGLLLRRHILQPPFLMRHIRSYQVLRRIHLLNSAAGRRPPVERGEAGGGARGYVELLEG